MKSTLLFVMTCITCTCLILLLAPTSDGSNANGTLTIKRLEITDDNGTALCTIDSYRVAKFVNGKNEVSHQPQITFHKPNSIIPPLRIYNDIDLGAALSLSSMDNQSQLAIGFDNNMNPSIVASGKERATMRIVYNVSTNNLEIQDSNGNLLYELKLRKE